jgi:hypothetical protein
VVTREETPATGARVLSAVLVLELLWLLLVAASVVFLAAHLSGDAEEFPADPVARRLLMLAVPPLAVVIGLALIGARQAVDRRIASPSTPVEPIRRMALWLTAAANAAVVVSILTSLYHAHATWIVVGLLLTAGLSFVAVACVRAARQ